MPSIPPDAQPLDSGQVTGPLPTPQPPVVPTPPGSEPFLDGSVGGPGTPVPPNLPGIAEEVGRIEGKLKVIAAKIQNPVANDGLLDLLRAIADLLLAAYPGGSYSISSPCLSAGEGSQSEPVVAAWGGGIGRFAEINARVDALASIVAATKDLPQPVCVKQREGAPVTVILREV